MTTSGPISTPHLEAGRSTVQHSATGGKQVVNHETMESYINALTRGFTISTLNTFGGDVYYAALYSGNIDVIATPLPVDCTFSFLTVKTQTPATGGYIEYEIFKNKVTTGVIVTQAEGVETVTGPVDVAFSTNDNFAVKKTSFGAAAASTVMCFFFTPV